MTIPVLTEKNLRQSGQWKGMVLWVQRRARSLRQCGQRTPAGQRPLMNHRSAASSFGKHPHQVDQRDPLAVVLAQRYLFRALRCHICWRCSILRESGQAP